jgi:tetratricopeptide (TPR) repeat protein
MPHLQQQENVQQSVESYFTDVEQVRNLFVKLLAESSISKRLLIIHGLGGVGKSSLLRMFELDCKKARVPVALASGDEDKSAVQILSDWANDLKAGGIRLSEFTKTYEYYRVIQARVDEQARKVRDVRSKTTEVLGKATTKTAETAAGAAIGAAVGSLVPGIGTLVGALGGAVVGTTAEELMDFFQSFLSKPAINLLLDPVKKLTDDFLHDVARIATKRRIVLILDTFEQMTRMNEWSCEVAKRLHRNTLLVIAGREMVNWDRQWPGWLASTHVQLLEPMTPEVMRDLVRNYNATQIGAEPNSEQVEKIISFARGLPIAITTAVRLWIKYHMDFDEVKGEALHELVKRLIEGVPQEMIPVLMAAAAVRYFNKETLRAVAGQVEVNAVYDELRHFPFVFPSREGLRLHNTIREILDDSLEMDDREQHRQLHERAAVYFEKNLEKSMGEEANQMELEHLYHRILADEELGIKLFQERAEELVRFRLIDRLHVLLNDVNTYPLKRENSKLWREYYNARLAHLETRIADAEKIYQAIGENVNADPKLRAYALCDWGEIWTRYERLSKKDGTQKAIDILERSQKIAPTLDPKLIFVLQYLRIIYLFKGDWDKVLPLVEQQKLFFQDNGDKYGMVFAYSVMKAVYGMLGDWKEALTAQTQGLQELSILPEARFLEVRLKGFYSWVSIWCGRWNEAELALLESLPFLRESGNIDLVGALYQDLGLVMGMQGKYLEAAYYFAEGLKEVEHLGKEYLRLKGIGLGFWGAILTLQDKSTLAEDYLKDSLNIKREVQDKLGTPEILNWFGELYEIRQNWSEAEAHYHRIFDLNTGRHYFECSAFTGLARIKHMLGDFANISPLLTEAEKIAQQYEYNDHLASIRLTQAHTTWDDSSNSETAFDVALHYYQQALIYGLRFNRFLLDSLLSGRSRRTPLRSIITHCLEKGAEGYRMLIAIQDWWRTGVNKIVESPPQTISPIAEGSSLLDGESMARKREPGDGSPQRTVEEQIESVLVV